jgi:salicylate hydroxylase
MEPPLVQQPSSLQLNAIVVGADLGGLATDIALKRDGHNVTVYEQAAELAEVEILRAYLEHG